MLTVLSPGEGFLSLNSVKFSPRSSRLFVDYSLCALTWKRKQRSKYIQGSATHNLVQHPVLSLAGKNKVSIIKELYLQLAYMALFSHFLKDGISLLKKKTSVYF